MLCVALLKEARAYKSTPQSSYGHRARETNRDRTRHLSIGLVVFREQSMVTVLLGVTAV